MGVLTDIEPKSVFRYFEELSQIPHGSGNTKHISDYCVGFAKEHGLRYIQDGMNNVVIYKDGTPGYEDSAPVMIQGHLDMVCEKTADRQIDFENEGLKLVVDGDYVYAEGTTLGGDDGIAVAYALAVLDADDIAHPPIEAVFTVDEEIGMFGAAALDASCLKSRIMMNIDSEEEGTLLVSCAGGCTATCHLPVKRQERKGVTVTLKISGLTGGHSGVEIDKGRANASRLLGRALNELSKTVSYSLISVDGGLKDNAIPREAAAELMVAQEDFAELSSQAANWGNVFAAEYSVTEPNLSLTMTVGSKGKASVMDDTSKRRVIAALVNLPGGIQRMSRDIAGLVQTSLNLGILKTDENEVTMSFALRSSVGTEKQEMVSRIENMMDVIGGSLDVAGSYPAWEYKHDSKLRDLMVKIYEEQYDSKPNVQAIHAGLECGIFAGKLPGLDCVSFGPNMMDIHTTNEHLSISSVQRTWKYITEILRRLK